MHGFWLSLIVHFTSAFALNCSDLCKVNAEDNDHVILQMVVHIAKIVGHCLYILFSIVVVWNRYQLFSVSLQITGNVSLHKQTPLHITLSKLVFTSHYNCFYFMVICPVSWANKPVVSSRLNDFNTVAADFEQVIVSVILFAALFANQIMVCSTSGAHVSLMLSFLWNPRSSAVDFEQVLFPVICFLLCFQTRYWYVPCQQYMCHWCCLFVCLWCVDCWFWTGCCSSFIVFSTFAYLTLTCLL